MSDRERPLEGIRVIELGQLLAVVVATRQQHGGPVAAGSQGLQDLGAAALGMTRLGTLTHILLPAAAACVFLLACPPSDTTDGPSADDGTEQATESPTEDPLAGVLGENGSDS